FGYYKSMQQAESSIEKMGYAKALSVYKNAFSQYPHAFYGDLHNACLCAIKTKDYETAYQYAKQLVSHGCELTYFNDSVFAPLHASAYWKQFDKEYNGIRNKYLANIDYGLRKEYFDMLHLDQSNRRLGKPEQQADSIFFINAAKTVKLIREKGFPEWFVNNDSIYNISALFGHYCLLYNKINAPQNKQKYNTDFYNHIRSSKILDTIRICLKEGLVDGLLVPIDYERMITHNDFSNPYGELSIVVDLKDEKVTPKIEFTESEIEAINTRRDSICLPPISTETAQNYINTSWYKEYPFKDVKKAMAACQGCPRPVIVSTITETEIPVMDKFRIPENYGFRLKTLVSSSITIFYNY
ncbi:MAG: hypothetical protein QM654_18230, partial [Dysgonamonadaceae bacterium]